jgi:hypothetical protein
MTDKEHDVETLLRRYRPADPQPELRGRILADHPAARAWPWAAATAALLALTVTLRTGAGVQIERAYAPPVDTTAAAIEELTRWLGGTAEARAIAEAAAFQERVREARLGLAPGGDIK